MIPALKSAVAHFGNDPQWKTCRPPLIELRSEERSAGPAARYWALADLAANLSDAGERARVIECARGEPFASPGGRALRPLAILGGLGRRALARGGRPLLDGRVSALAALRLGLLGR
jgi:phytoene synthase